MKVENSIILNASEGDRVVDLPDLEDNRAITRRFTIFLDIDEDGIYGIPLALTIRSFKGTNKAYLVSCKYDGHYGEDSGTYECVYEATILK